MKKGFREEDVRILWSILLLGGFQNSSKHDKRVGVHSSHSAQRLAHIVGIDAKWHLWPQRETKRVLVKSQQEISLNSKNEIFQLLEDNFSFVTGFNEFWFFNLDVAGALSPLPQDLHQFSKPRR